jgi:serine/threonine protein kinase
MDFDSIKIIKKLGSGMFGTAYLSKYNNKKYVLKIQKILDEDIKKNYKSSVWRELDIYKYISEMKKTDQIFFTRLYDYKIINKCNHNQKISLLSENNNSDYIFKQLKESKYCVKFLLEYKGNMTLTKYLEKRKPSIKQIISIMIQICNIIYILYLAGYSHNDLHSNNLMVNKTNKKYFNFSVFNKKIPYMGIQISVIDYGNILHKKYKSELEFQKLFILDVEKFMFNEMFYTCQNLNNNFNERINKCKKMNKKLPWEIDPFYNDNIIRKIYKYHNNFFKLSIKKYSIYYPTVSKIINKIIKELIKKRPLYDIIRKLSLSENILNDISTIINRITMEFEIIYPDKYKKYSLWCIKTIKKIPKNLELEMLKSNNYLDFCNILVNEILFN